MLCKEPDIEDIEESACGSWFALAWDGLHLEELGVSHQSHGRLSRAVLATFLRHVLAKASTGMSNIVKHENWHGVLCKGYRTKDSKTLTSVAGLPWLGTDCTLKSWLSPIKAVADLVGQF